MITSAPSARSSRAFSWDILSGIVKMHRYPFTAAASANPTPVFPEVASTINPPGRSRPSRSAASIIATPIRSFTEPPGLKNSALAYSGVRIPWVSLLRRTSGVHPIVSRTFAYGLVWAGTAVRFRLARVPPHTARIPRRGGGVAPRAGGIREHAGRCPPRGARVRPGSGEQGGRSKRRGCGGRRRPPGSAAIRFSRAGRPTGRGAAELDRLQERRRDREAAPPRGGEPQLFRARERRRVERRIPARLGDLARLRHEPPHRVGEQPQHDVAFGLLVVQPRRILDRRIRVERHGRLLIRRRGGRRLRLVRWRRRRAASGRGEPGHPGEREPPSHGASSSPFFPVARRVSASTGGKALRSRPSGAARSGG